MSELLIRLPLDRDRCGTLSLLDSRGRRVCGPFFVAARASDEVAAANGNVRRDPLLRYGDTPTGDYAVRRIVPTGRRTRFAAARFGSHGLVVLEGIGGDAALAEANGRYHLVISGGSLSPEGRLRSTAGSLRVADNDMRKLVAALRPLTNVRCQILEEPSLRSRQRVFADPRCWDLDPLELPVARSSASPYTREALIGGAAGALMLELSVAFVGLPAQPARASEAPTVHQVSFRPEVRFTLPAAKPGHDYVRLAYGTPQDQKAIDQLNALHHTGPEYNQHTIDTPGPAAPPVVQPQPSNGPVDPAIKKQQEINAIQSEKPPPNATQDQLKQWQQDKQTRIQQILNGKQ